LKQPEGNNSGRCKHHPQQTVGEREAIGGWSYDDTSSYDGDLHTTAHREVEVTQQPKT